jgi:hypothetical protein
MLRRAVEQAVRLHATPEPQMDQCCVFARLVLRQLYGAAAVDRAPVADWHLWDVARPWSPVEAAQLAGIAVSVSLPPAVATPKPGMLHQCQGWRGTPGAAGVTGHTWLWWAVSETAGLQIDSAAPPFRAAPAIQLRPRMWADVVAPYRFGVAVAVLKQV